MNSVIADLGNKSAKDLVSITHRVNAPWYRAASENQVLELLLNAKITKTDFVLNMSTLIEHDERKMAIYEDFVEYH